MSVDVTPEPTRDDDANTLMRIKSESEARLDVLLANISDIVTVLGPDGEWISSNGAGSKMLGWVPNIDPEGGIFALVHPDDIEPAFHALREVIAGTRTSDDPIDLRVMDSEGDYHILENVGENLIDHPLVHGVVLTSHDVTAARAAQRKLEGVTAQVTTLVSSLAEAVLLLDEARMVVIVNQPFMDMFLIDGNAEDYPGRPAADLAVASGAPYADHDTATAVIVERFHDTEPTFEELITMLDGRVLERDSIPVMFGDGQRGHLWVVRDVTEREEITRRRADLLEESIQAQVRAEQQHRALLELTEMRSQFVATISHELRTPLASILSFSELLRGDLETAGLTEQREFVDAIERNARRLMRLVNDLLLLRRIEAGAMTIDRTSGTMDALVNGAVNALEPLAAARKQRLETWVGPGPDLFVDLGRLDQVLVNLLSNAVKFTPERGVIAVTATYSNTAHPPGRDTATEPGRTARRDDEGWTITVADTGVGIPADEQTHLFERFYRGSQSATGVSGTGLGLAISRAVVELHGGRIRIDSEVGVGTTATVELPVANAEMQPADP